ncbi:MAG: alpha-1,2-fucosyltransferase [Lachnospiraceae bacterium]
MKIQFLNGGLANQAFQYIFARYYELSHPWDKMYMDDSYFALHTVHNGYELEKVFGIRPHMLSECFTPEVWSFILEEKRKGKSVPQVLSENGTDIYMLSEVGDACQSFNPFDGKIFSLPTNQYMTDILDLPGNIYYHGYWINKSWFSAYRETFLKELCFPEIPDQRNQAYLEQILSCNSVSVHVRRGDYVTLNVAYRPDEYSMLIKSFTSQVPDGAKWHLFVFSDDITWCREHAQELGFHSFQDITYVEGNTEGKNYLDLQLMSKCKGMILSNSAFCYLAALLNTEKQYMTNPRERNI